MKNWSRILAGIVVAGVISAALLMARAQTRDATGAEARQASQRPARGEPRSGRGPAKQLKEYDFNGPGFGFKTYMEFFDGFHVEYPRQITMADEMDLMRAGPRLAQSLMVREQMGKSALREWANLIMGVIERMEGWDNVFLVECEGGEVVNFTAPRGERFLAGVDDQPFIFKFKLKNSNKMYVIKRKEVDLEAWGGVRLTVDPTYPTLFKLFVSGIQEGAHSYPLKLYKPDGELLYETRFEMRGVKPGHIKVKLVEGDTGKRTEALLGLFPANGRDLPPNTVPYYLMWGQTYVRLGLGGLRSVRDARACIVKGGFEMPVYPGPCRIVATKGPEYRVSDETFDVPSGGIIAKVLTLERFMDLRKHGWYSGDDHCHIGRDPLREDDIMDLLSAVDLRVTNIVQMGDENRLYFLQSTWGELSRYWYGDRVMIAGQEDPRTTWRGHTLMYNIQNTIHDRDTYYLYEDAFKEARRQGGLTGYAHSASAFKAELGASVSIPLGLVDFVELDTASGFSTDVAYHFWNLGFRVSVFNGSDFPWGQIPGGKRFFAYVDGDFTVDKYLESLKAGHTFISQQGAFIDMRVNGKLPGSVIEVEADEPVTVTIRAALNPDYDALGRIEIVRHGKAIETFTPEGEGDVTMECETTLKLDKSCWIAGRMFGKTGGISPTRGATSKSGAHTSPFYIIIDGKPFWDEENLEAELARANKSLDQLAELAKEPTELKAKQRDRLLDYIEQAREVYRAMAEGKGPALQ